MKILIIGGTKFIGKEVKALAMAAGHEVVLFNRGVEDPDPECKLIKGNIDTIDHCRNELLSVDPDVVIHCISNTEKNAQDFLSVFKDHRSKAVILSSMDCYEAFQMANRGKEVSDYPIDESMPISSIKYYWRGTQHSQAHYYDKNLMTNIYLDAYRDRQLRPVILRLPCVYGPGDYQYMHRHGSIIKRIFDKQNTFVMGSISQAAIITHGYISNVAAAILHAAKEEGVEGKVYNVGEEKVRTKRRWAELYAKAANWQFDFEILPEEVISEDITLSNRPPVNLIFDCTSFRRDTGFCDPVSLEEGIRKTLNWALEHPDVLGDLPDYEREIGLLKRYKNILQEVVVKEELA